MKFILLADSGENFFEKGSAVLVRDFLRKFEQNGDLQSELINYIEDLEKFDYLSLPKEQFYDKLSKMIYGLRARRIRIYKILLEDYLADKENYKYVLLTIYHNIPQSSLLHFLITSRLY
jgi:hypothetical protein